MRYERIATLLQLAFKLAGTREGLTIGEVEAEFAVSRRTAERMLEAIRVAFPQVVEVASDDRRKRWCLPQGALRGLLAAETEELVELDAAARRMRNDGAADGRAEALERLAAKLRVVMQPAALSRTAPDVELLMEVEGSAVRPGPRPRVPAPVLGGIREALLSCRQLRLQYRSAGFGPEGRERIVAPLGLLHGQRPYLVAQLVGHVQGPSVFRLDRIVALALLDVTFTRDPGFSLMEYAQRSFGVWQEPPLDVCLRFSAEAAAEAAAFHFHATQTLEPLPDGGLLVRLRAGGSLEMCQHLATWGEAVEILAPDALREQMAAWSQDLADHHDRHPSAGDA